MVDQVPTTSGKVVIFFVPALELQHTCMSAHTLIPCHVSADGDDAKAEMVHTALHEANLSEKDIREFDQSDLLAMYKGGYKSAHRIQNAQRAGLEKCLDLALVDIIVKSQLGEPQDSPTDVIACPLTQLPPKSHAFSMYSFLSLPHSVHAYL